jgi:hypothetical protein
VELEHLQRQRRQAHRRAAPRDGTAVGLREEQHVVDQHRHALHLLEVGQQRLAQRLGRALARQRQLGLADEVGQRRAQLVRDVGVEALELRIGLLEPRHQRVELLDPGQQFLGRIVQHQPLVEPARRDGARLRGQLVELAQLAPHVPVRSGGDHRPGSERDQDQDPRPALAHQRVACVVHGEAGAQLAARHVGRGDGERLRLRVLGVRQRRAGGIRMQHAAVGAPDLEPRVAAHRRVAAQPRQHRRLAAAARLRRQHGGEQLAAPLQVLAVALDDEHLHRHPGRERDAAEHEHGEQRQLLRQPRADGVAAGGHHGARSSST